MIYLQAGEEGDVAQSIDLLGCASRDSEERCGAAINKQRRKADAEQTSPENNNNDLLQAYLHRQAPGHTLTHTHTDKENPMKRD